MMKKSRLKSVLTALLILITLSSCNGGSEISSSEPPSSIISTLNSYIVEVDGYKQKVTENDKAVKPNDPYKEGYKFIGWFTEDDQQFSFDSIITRNYVIHSRFEKLLDYVKVDYLNVIEGNFGSKDENTIISTLDYSFAIFNDYSFVNGEFEFETKGSNNHGVYFRLNSEEIDRGRPTGDFFELRIDSYGNVILYRSKDSSYTVEAASLAIRTNYSPDIFYSFKIRMIDKNIWVFSGYDLILSYVANNTLPSGSRVGVFAYSAETEFKLNVASDTFVQITNYKTLEWSKIKDVDKYVVEVNNQNIDVSKDKTSYDLSTLNIPTGSYEVKVFTVSGSNKVLLGSTTYYVEGVASDLTVYNGKVASLGDNYITRESNTLALLKDKTFNNGSIEASITPNVANDCGIIFRASTGGLTSFWEHPGCSYYVVIINTHGNVYLGKVNYNNVTWTELKNGVINNFNPANKYDVKINVLDGYIEVFINETNYSHTTI